jgi:hypothetical protein
VVIGQEIQDKLEALPGPLILLDEWEFSGLGIDTFWDQVTDSLSLHEARPVYFDIADESNVAAFQDYLNRRKLSVDYSPAPWADNFFTGLATCNDWLREGRLDLNKSSLARAQLKNIKRDDLRDTEKPERKFPLVNALRHVVSGFRKIPSSRPLRMGEFKNLGGTGGWMI